MKVEMIMVSESRGKKKGGKKGKKTGRSLMLSEVMPFLSGDLGEKIQAAVEKQDGDQTKALMTEVGEQLRKKFERNK